MNLVQIGTNEFFPNSLFPIPANHPLLHRKLNGFFFAMSTSRFGRDVWSCVPPCSDWRSALVIVPVTNNIATYKSI